MHRRALVLLAQQLNANKTKTPFSPLVPRVHYWDVPEIMDRIERWQQRSPAPRPSVQHQAQYRTQPVSAAAQLETHEVEVEEATEAENVGTWMRTVKRCQKAKIPARLQLTIPKWGENYLPIGLAVVAPIIGIWRLYIGSRVGFLEFVSILPIALPFRAFRYCSSLTLKNPDAQKDQWIFELVHLPVFPFLSPVITQFRLREVEWAIIDEKIQEQVKLRVLNPTGQPLGGIGRALGLDECVVETSSPEVAQEVKEMFMSLRGTGKNLLRPLTPEDEVKIRDQLRKRDYTLMCIAFGFLNLFFFGFLLSYLSSTKQVQEKGLFGAVMHYFRLGA